MLLNNKSLKLFRPKATTNDTPICAAYALVSHVAQFTAYTRRRCVCILCCIKHIGHTSHPYEIFLDGGGALPCDQKSETCFQVHCHPRYACRRRVPCLGPARSSTDARNDAFTGRIEAVVRCFRWWTSDASVAHPLCVMRDRCGTPRMPCDVARATIVVTGPAGVEAKAATYAVNSRVRVSKDTSVRWLLFCVLFCTRDLAVERNSADALSRLVPLEAAARS